MQGGTPSHLQNRWHQYDVPLGTSIFQLTVGPSGIIVELRERCLGGHPLIPATYEQRD